MLTLPAGFTILKCLVMIMGYVHASIFAYVTCAHWLKVWICMSLRGGGGAVCNQLHNGFGNSEIGSYSSDTQFGMVNGRGQNLGRNGDCFIPFLYCWRMCWSLVLQYFEGLVTEQL